MFNSISYIHACVPSRFYWNSDCADAGIFDLRCISRQSSNVTVQWDIPVDQQPGTYHIMISGNAQTFNGTFLLAFGRILRTLCKNRKYVRVRSGLLTALLRSISCIYDNIHGPKLYPSLVHMRMYKGAELLYGNVSTLQLWPKLWIQFNSIQYTSNEGVGESNVNLKGYN